jgi:hypothetical protein
MFVKLYSRITESSLMEEDVVTRYTFLMMLAISDPTGLVIGTDVAIARRINLPFGDFVKSVKRLSQPDENSNSKEEEGRRVISSKGERGYQMVNYEKYRNLKDEEQKREYHRVYMKNRRAALNPVKACEATLTKGPHAEADAEADEIKVESGTSPTPTPKQEELIPDSTPKAKRFVPPTREEANVYAVELGLPGSEVDNFMDFYGSIDWKVGKNKMVSWRMCLSRWARKWKTEAGQNGRPNPGASLVSVDSRASYEAYKDRMDPGLVD